MKRDEGRPRQDIMQADVAATPRGHRATVIPLEKQARDYLVLTTQRTGSSWLMDMINALPGVEGHMELFYHSPRKEPPRAGQNDWPRFVESRKSTASGLRPLATMRYLRNFYARRTAVGFKLMYSQLREYPEILPWLAWRRLPIVHLVRENHLDVVISEALANATGSSHATVGERTRVQTLALDTDSLVARIRRLAAKQSTMRRLVRSLPNPVFEVSYEKLRDDEVIMASIGHFLAVRDAPAERPGSSLVKRQQATHDKVLENFREVRDVLQAGGFEHLLRRE